MKQQHFAKSQECMRLNVVVVSKWPECFQFLTFEQGLFCVWAQFPGSLTILCVQKFIRSIEGAYLHGMWRYIGSYLANKGEKGKNHCDDKNNRSPEEKERKQHVAVFISVTQNILQTEDAGWKMMRRPQAKSITWSHSRAHTQILSFLLPAWNVRSPSMAGLKPRKRVGGGSQLASCM